MITIFLCLAFLKDQLTYPYLKNFPKMLVFQILQVALSVCPPEARDVRTIPPMKHG